MPDSSSQPPRHTPWENGWTPDTSRAPGTRRLWLAGTLAFATIVACVTAIVVTDKESDQSSQTRQADPTAPVDADGPGLLSFGSPSKSAPTPTHTPTSAKPPSPSAASAKHGSPPAATTPAPAKSTPSHGSSSGSSSSSATWKSVRSVNYPDRYWHVSGDYVKLDRISSSSARRDATFALVKGLADSSCYSFATADGTYLRHRDFILRAERDDGSSLFKQDATFCPRASSYSGAVMLESVNYPGRFLRHQSFQLKLDPYQNSDLYRADSAFQLVDGLN